MAPGAMQVAAFEKDYHSDSRTIVYGVSFYIEDQAFRHLFNLKIGTEVRRPKNIPLALPPKRDKLFKGGIPPAQLSFLTSHLLLPASGFQHPQNESFSVLSITSC
jgi:hypothetical protein